MYIYCAAHFGRLIILLAHRSEHMYIYCAAHFGRLIMSYFVVDLRLRYAISSFRSKQELNLFNIP